MAVAALATCFTTLTEQIGVVSSITAETGNQEWAAKHHAAEGLSAAAMAVSSALESLANQGALGRSET